MTEPTQKGARSRRQILEAANRLFYEKGFEQTSFKDIVDATGMRKGNINYYFRNKDELLHMVLDYRLILIEDLLAGWEREFPGPKERLLRFAQMISNERDDIIHYGCPMGSLNTELGKLWSQMQLHAREMFDLFLNWLTEQFQAVGSNPGKAKQQARHLLILGQGISVMAQVYRDANLLEAEVQQMQKWIEEQISRP